jgi:hypothetical protein
VTVVVRTYSSQESRIVLLSFPIGALTTTAAYSGIIIRGCEDGDAAGCGFTAKGKVPTIDRNVYLVFDRVSRYRMGPCGCRHARVLVIVSVWLLVNDAEYWSSRIAVNFVVRSGKKVMVVAGIEPNFVVTVQTG